MGRGFLFMKETYYFPHDTNATHDPKCLALINDFGVHGYGFYWLLIEVLHQQRDGRLEKFPKLYDGLAYEFKTTKEDVAKLIEAMLHQYNLLKEDDTHIWSDRVIRNLENRRIKCEVKAESGRIGGIKSGISRRTLKQNEAPLKANEQKERKGKEIKEKNTTVANDATPRPLTDTQKIVTAFKMLQGFDKDDKAWDKMYFARFSKSASALLEFIGNWKDAIDCCQDVYEKLSSKGLTVTLETISKHAGEWLKDKREKEGNRGILSR